MRALLAIVATLLLSACATPSSRPGQIHDRIEREMQEAALAKGRPASADAVSQALLPPLTLTPPVGETAEARFDLVVNNASAQQVFTAIVSGTRYSMLLGPEVAGTLTLNLKDVTVRDALDVIRELYGYDYRIQGTRIYVQPNSMQTRLFQINYLAGRRQGASELRVTGSTVSAATTAPGAAAAAGTSPAPATPTPTPGMPSQRGLDSARVSTSSDSDFWRELTKALDALVGSEGGRSVIVNPLSGVILVRGLPQDIRNVENYLRATQLVVERQVMLEAKIIEVELNDEYQAGINWGSFRGRNGGRGAYGVIAPGSSLTTVDPATGAANVLSGPNTAILPGRGGSGAVTSLGRGFFGLAFQTANFAALLNFLEGQGSVHVLSSPRIATLNNQKAVLKVGTDEFFVTNISTTTTTSGTSTVTTPTITVQPFFSGIALDVTPQIDENNMIVLHVHPSVSNVTEKQKILDLGSQIGQFTLPLASSTINETDSIVRVQDGNIVAIGGLMKQEQSRGRTGLPGTAGGGIGDLFGQRTSNLKKKELVILLKPTVIQDESSWRQDVLDTQSRIQALDPRTPAVPADN